MAQKKSATKKAPAKKAAKKTAKTTAKKAATRSAAKSATRPATKPATTPVTKPAPRDIPQKLTRPERLAGLLAGATPRADAGVLVDTLVLMLAADGEMKPGELEEAVAIAQRLPAFKGKPEAEVKGRVVDSVKAIMDEGREGRLDLLADKLTGHADREDAFRLAAALRFADGEVADEEDQLLFALRTALHIEPERADLLIEDVERRLFKA